MEENNDFPREKRFLMIRRRRIPLAIPYVKGEEARKHHGMINQLIFIYKNFETMFAVKAGDVFLARFPLEFGSEIHGDHFVVAILDSSAVNPLITVVPLKSEKDRELNPASDIRIGVIPGINNNKRTVAVINQIRAIDKRRLISVDALNALNEHMRKHYVKEYEELCVQRVSDYRLTAQQLTLIRKTAIGFIVSNYVSHDDELLVDF